MKEKHVLVHDPARAKKRHGASRAAAPRKRTAVAAAPENLRVGLWDLGAWLGTVNRRLVDRFNQAQDELVFYEVVAAVPVGLSSSPQRVASWFEEDVFEKLTKDDLSNIAENVIANEFFTAAESVRADLGVDYLVGITPSMVAGADEEGAYWNHFSTFEERLVLASTYQLREFARESGVAFEFFLGGIIVAQVLVAMCYPKLNFHPDRDCLFDYRADRVSLARSAENVSIEPTCLRAIKPRYRKPAEALLAAVKSFGDQK